jgi:hypothetical protein
MAGEHARIDLLPAVVDTAFASPAQDRLADVSDALAATLTSHLAHGETDALPDPHAFTGAERKAVGWRIATATGQPRGAEFLALMLDGLSRCGCYRGLESPVGKVSH